MNLILTDLMAGLVLLTFEVKDIDGEQFYRLYPISNDGGGVIFNDLKMDSSYDEDEENLDNILITIKFK